MGAFNFSAFAGASGGGGGSQYGVLSDQLTIKENQLAGDGKLSPGDYDLLIGMAQSAANSPGLSSSQRSNMLVKISGYKKGKNTNDIADAQDIGKLSRTFQNDMKKVSLLAGNSPQTFLQGKVAALESKMFTLQDAIQQQDAAGNDSSAAMAELLATNESWQDTQKAIQVSQAPAAQGGAPQGDFVAYIETGPDGKIRNIDIARAGSKTGYLQTNGILGGFPIAGKVNSQTSGGSGKNSFRLGDTTFSAPDVLRPSADGTMKPSTLIAESQQQALGTHGMTKATAGYFNVDPASVKTQGTAQPGDWVQSGGIFYKHNTDGTYEKYVGGDKQKLGIDDGQLLSNLPDEVIATINKRVTKTVDASQFTAPAPAPSSFDPNTSSSTPAAAPGWGSPGDYPNVTREQAWGGKTYTAGDLARGAVGKVSQVAHAIERAPSQALAIAGSLKQKAGGLLAGIFGGDKTA